MKVSRKAMTFVMNSWHFRDTWTLVRCSHGGNNAGGHVTKGSEGLRRRERPGPSGRKRDRFRHFRHPPGGAVTVPGGPQAGPDRPLIGYDLAGTRWRLTMRRPVDAASGRWSLGMSWTRPIRPASRSGSTSSGPPAGRSSPSAAHGDRITFRGPWTPTDETPWKISGCGEWSRSVGDLRSTGRQQGRASREAVTSRPSLDSPAALARAPGAIHPRHGARTTGPPTGVIYPRSPHARPTRIAARLILPASAALRVATPRRPPPSRSPSASRRLRRRPPGPSWNAS